MMMMMMIMMAEMGNADADVCMPAGMYVYRRIVYGCSLDMNADKILSKDELDIQVLIWEEVSMV